MRGTLGQYCPNLTVIRISLGSWPLRQAVGEWGKESAFESTQRVLLQAAQHWLMAHSWEPLLYSPGHWVLSKGWSQLETPKGPLGLEFPSG